MVLVLTSVGSGNTLTFNIAYTVATLVGSDTFTNKTLTSPTLTSAVLNTALSGTAFLDEDNMASDSNNKMASQQSIKAYVDTLLAAQDLDFAPDSGTGQQYDLDSETLTFSGGTEVGTTCFRYYSNFDAKQCYTLTLLTDFNKQNFYKSDN